MGTLINPFRFEKTYAQNVLDRSPIRYWKHNDAVSTAILLDSSTTGDATMGTTAGLRAQLGKPSLLASDAGTCADYLGTASYFANNTNQTGLGVSAITVECWFQADANTGILMCRDAGSTAVSWRLWLNAGKLEFRFWTVAGGTGTVYNVVGSTALAIDGTTKYYGAATYDGTDANVYVNANLDGTLAQSGALRVPSSTGLYLGIHGSGATPLNARMGHNAIFGAAHTQPVLAQQFAAAA